MTVSVLFKNFALIYPLYFIYGLTFLFLGASIAIKDMKASSLKLSGILWWLSLFGFSHGAHEWIELFLLVKATDLTSQALFWIQAITLIVVLLSFLFLLEFGLSLAYAISSKRVFSWARVGAVALFMVLLFYLGSYQSTSYTDFFRKTDMLYRIIFCLSGSWITGLGLMAYARSVKQMSRSIARFFCYTGLGFIFYGIVGGLVPSHTTLPMIPVPVEFFRGLAAVLITYFLMKALNIFDIETRHALEQKIRRLAQSEKMASLGQLAAGIAHGINTPLTNASLSLQMLRNQIGNLPEAVGITTKLDAVERSIDRAATIAKELLQFSHVKETQLVENDVNQVLDNAIDLIQYKLKTVTIAPYKTKLPRVLCDAAKLEQVFINILNNAIEAMPEGGEITIRNGYLADEVWITFSDTGPGIPDAYLAKAFDPFFTTKKIGKGTGLGLSICYAIIDQHQGKIELEGNKGQGATVIIHLPIPANRRHL